MIFYFQLLIISMPKSLLLKCVYNLCIGMGNFTPYIFKSNKSITCKHMHTWSTCTHVWNALQWFQCVRSASSFMTLDQYKMFVHTKYMTTSLQSVLSILFSIDRTAEHYPPLLLFWYVQLTFTFATDQIFWYLWLSTPFILCTYNVSICHPKTTV